MWVWFWLVCLFIFHKKPNCSSSFEIQPTELTSLPVIVRDKRRLRGVLNFRRELFVLHGTKEPDQEIIKRLPEKAVQKTLCHMIRS